MLKTTVRPTGEEELDDYVKDLVEITIKMMVSSLNLCKTHKTGDLQKSKHSKMLLNSCVKLFLFFPAYCDCVCHS